MKADGLRTPGRMPVLLACFLLSGLAGLVYQTVWTQQFALVFGTSELAIAAVLAAYMAGLATGAGSAARWVGRLRRPLLVYALLEIGIAVTALLVPAGLELASRLQLTLLGGGELAGSSGSPVSAFFYLVAAFVVLLAPTALMGASLPVLARYAVQKDTQIGSRVGWLYAVNTAGAAAGTLLAAYTLLPRFGLSGTVLVAVAVNGVVFLLALALAKTTGSRASATGKTTSPAHRPGGPHWILPVMLASGFVSFAYEVLWTRLLSQLLGGTLYAFATMLATFLCGITLGAAAAGFFAGTRDSARSGFVFAQVGIALCSLGAFSAAGYLPAIATSLAAGGSSFTSIAPLAALTLLPGALFMGATFPFAVRILAGTADEAGTASGRVFAWNTVGAIGGAIATGFYLLPALQFEGTVQLAVVVGASLALATALATKPRTWTLGLPAVAIILVVMAWPPGSPTRVLMTSPLTGRTMPGEPVFTAVGRSATTMLVKQGPNWRLTTNGLPESMIQGPGSRTAGAGIAHWLGLLPTAGLPDAESVLVIGFGAGRTLEAIAPTVRDVRVIELEPEVIRANQFVEKMRGTDPLQDSRLTVHLNDARSGLQLATQHFDAIVSQPSHPWTGGASHLFTREFFQLVRQRLNPRGVFVQWIGLTFVDQQLLLSLLASLNDVFEHVEVFLPPPGGAVLFLASKQSPVSRTSAAAGLESGGELWHRLGVLSHDDILAARLLDASASRRLSEDAPLNTDNRNLLRLHPPGRGGKPMSQGALVQMLGEQDALVGWQPENGSLYLLRRLLAVGQNQRARRVASGIEDSGLAAVADALIELNGRNKQAAEQALWRALSLDRASDEAFFALVGVHQANIISGETPVLLTARLAADPVARTVARGWQLSTSRQSAAIRDLEPELATVQVEHPLYSNAVRLRVAWRLASGDPERAREAITLYDPLLAVRANTQELTVRARLAMVADQPATVVATLVEIFGKLPPPARRNERDKAMVSQLVKMLDALPGDPGLEESVEFLRGRLTAGERGQ